MAIAVTAPPALEAVSSALLGWARLGLGALARGYRAFVLTLVLIGTAPTLLGWSTFVVGTGSMEPVIAPGDLVVGMPWSPDDSHPVLGRVMVFDDPADGADRLLVHRVVEKRDDGLFTTAGDANAFTDTTPVPREAFRARAVVLVPWVGLPLVWARDGSFVALGLWLLVTVALFVRAGRRDDGTRTRRSAGVVAVALVTVAAVAVSVTQTQARAAFTARATSGSSTWAAGAGMLPYVAAVTASKPYAFYLLDESSGDLMADRSLNGRTGSYAGYTDLGRPGALPANAGTSVGLNGVTDRLLSGGAAISNPTTFSIELWFRTTTRAGGKLFGFESTRNLTSATYDRHLYMREDGRLVYGQWSGSRVRTLVSPRALNDGAWHHLVLTVRPGTSDSYATMYVDGAAVASGAATRPSAFTGWWRFGFGTLPSNDPYPYAGFLGEVDAAAIYTSQLSAAEVATHYAAR